MCIFVCEVPAGSSCLSFLSVRFSVLDSTGGLTFTHTVILITIKTLFKWESVLKLGNAYLYEYTCIPAYVVKTHKEP